MWKRILVWFVGTGILSWVLHLPFSLLEDALYDWINTSIAQRWQMLIRHFFEWGIPILLAGFSVWFLIRFGIYLGKKQAGKVPASPSPISSSHTILIPKSRLSNRDNLFRAIYEFKDAANQLISIQEGLNKRNEQSPHTVAVEAMIKRDEGYDRCKQAHKELQAERLVAGQSYKKVISDLVSFVWVQVAMKRHKLPSVYDEQIELDSLQFAGRLEGMVEKATQEIDRISSQALDREDSQTK